MSDNRKRGGGTPGPDVDNDATGIDVEIGDSGVRLPEVELECTKAECNTLSDALPVGYGASRPTVTMQQSSHLLDVGGADTEISCQHP